MSIKILDAEQVATLLCYDRLIPKLKETLTQDWESSPRTHLSIAEDAETLLMPAWNNQHLGIKIANIFARNSEHGLPAVSSSYILCDGQTGQILAIIDGEILTARRTAAVAALAASYLSAPDADHLLVVGTGKVARQLISAMSQVRKLQRITIWGRRYDRAQALAQEVAVFGIDVVATQNLERAVRAASIIACATLSQEPLIKGEWLRDESHLSLIGSFRPEMREADSDAICRSFVVVDTRQGVLDEAGDVIIPIERGLIGPGHLYAELSEYCSGEESYVPKNRPTLFKSVGHPVQDMAAALLCVSGLEQSRTEGSA